MVEVERAASVIEGALSVSTAFNPHLGATLLVSPGVLENQVYGRRAAEPQGPFGRARALYVGTAPSALRIRDVRQHPAHARTDGRHVLTSYFTSPDSGPSGMRLVELELE